MADGRTRNVGRIKRWWVAALLTCACTTEPIEPAGVTADASALDATTLDAAPRDATSPTDAGAANDAGAAADAAPADAGSLACSRAPRKLEYIEIDVSDGKLLHASLDRPDAANCALPTVLIQTPYNIESVHATYYGTNRPDEPLFASQDYNFVAVDWRGSFGSRAAAITPPQPHAQDGFDIVEWIAQQVWSDGHVGTWGVSALCIQQYRTAVMRPPHLDAIVPIFCSMNSTYPAFYPGGVIRREYVEMLDALGFGVKAAIEQHPTFDNFWTLIGAAIRPANIDVPALVVAGWWDLYPIGSLRDFDALRYEGAPAIRGEHRLLAGGWIHFAAGTESNGAFRMPSAQEIEYFDNERRIQRDSLAFFDRHLRGHDNDAARWAPVRFNQWGEGWQSSDQWPPREASTMTYYLRADGSLSELMSPTTSTRSLQYDPADPSPTRGGGTLAPTEIHGPTSQADVLARTDDNLTFITSTMASPLRITGSVRIELDMATTGADTDLAVRLTDVDTNGDHRLIGEGIRRLKLRANFTVPDGVQANERYSMQVELTSDLAYTIPVGHRLGLIVSSANFPRFGRNPNDGADFFRQSASPVEVTNTVFIDHTAKLRIMTRP